MSTNRLQVNEMHPLSEDNDTHIDIVTNIENEDVRKKNSPSNGSMFSASIISKAAVISPRTLYCEALAHCLNDEFDVMYGVFGTLNSFTAAMRGKDPSGVIIILVEGYLQKTSEDIEIVINDLIDPSIVIIGDDKNYDQMGCIQQNVKAIIPVNSTLIVALQAIRLVQYGGVFFPRTSKAVVNDSHETARGRIGVLEGLTRTQLEVAEALRTGKSNKLIAHHLGMNEHTVKVHIRNILKRLGAGNRTEAALIISRNRANMLSNV